MARRTALLPALIAGAVLGCGAAALAAPGEAEAAFPGQNGKIAFEMGPRSCCSRPTHIATVDPDGTGFSRVTGDGTYRTLGSHEQDPAFSPDGTKLAFSASETTALDPYGPPHPTTDGEIYSVPAAGGTPAQLTDNDVGDGAPAWSPDGEKIAFVSLSDGGAAGFDVFVMNADGTQRTNLTPGRRGNQRDPAWSPDGERIAFTSSGAYGDRSDDVLMVPSGGGEPARIASSDASERDPSWSPDGKKIAFTSSWNIYTVPIAGGTPTALLDSGAVPVEEPAWSPDGELIAFSGIEDEYLSDVYAVPATGGAAFAITDNDISSAPDWGPIPGSAPPDTAAPTVVGVSPEARSGDARRGADVRASFSEEMRPSTVRSGTFGLVEARTGRRVAASVVCPSPCTRAKLDPSARLAANTRYRATVTTGAEDLAGNALDQRADAEGDQPKAWSFTTGD